MIIKVDGKVYKFPDGTSEDAALSTIKADIDQQKEIPSWQRSVINAAGAVKDAILSPETTHFAPPEPVSLPSNEQKMKLVKEILAKKQLSNLMESGGMLPQLNQRPPEIGKDPFADAILAESDLASNYGAAEGAANAATGMVSWIPAGLSMFSFDRRGLEQRAKDALGIQEALTYQPKTEAGQAVAETLAYPFTAMKEAGDYWGEALENRGLNALGAMSRFAGEAAPFMLPAGYALGRRGGRIFTDRINALARDLNLGIPETPRNYYSNTPSGGSPIVESRPAYAAEMNKRRTLEQQERDRLTTEQRDRAISDYGIDYVEGESTGGTSEYDVNNLERHPEYSRMIQDKKQGMLDSLVKKQQVRDVAAVDLLTDGELDAFGVTRDNVVGKTLAEFREEVRTAQEAAMSSGDLLAAKRAQILGNLLDRKALTYDPMQRDFIVGDTAKAADVAAGEGFSMGKTPEKTILRKGEPDVTIAEVPDRVDVTEIIQKKGKAEPFGTEESAKSAMRKRKLDPNDWEVIPHNEGFVIAKRKKLPPEETVNRLVIDDMITTVSEGEAGLTTDISQGLTQVTGRFTSNPSWYGKVLESLKKVGANKQEIINTLKNIRDDRPLTEKQQIIAQKLDPHIRELRNSDHYTKIESELTKKPVRESELAKGDKIVIDGEEFTHKGIDADGNAILQDGSVIRLKPDEVIRADEVVKSGEKPLPKGSTDFDTKLMAMPDVTQVPQVFLKLGRSILAKANWLETSFQPWKVRDKLGNLLPQFKEWIMDRQEMIGKHALAALDAKRISELWKAISKADQEKVYFYLDGRIKLDAVPSHLKSLAETSRGILDRLGKFAVENGLLSEEQVRKGGIMHIFNEHQKNPQLFEKKGYGGISLLNDWSKQRHSWGYQDTYSKITKENYPQLSKAQMDALKGFLTDEFGGEAGKGRHVVSYKDLDPELKPLADALRKQVEERGQMERGYFGELHDSPHAITENLMNILTDAATKEFFKKVSGYDDIVLDFKSTSSEGLPKVLGKIQIEGIPGEKMSLNNAIKRLDKLRETKKAGRELTESQTELLSKLEKQLGDIEHIMGKKLKDYVLLKGEKYGDLNGKYVHRRVAQDLAPLWEFMDSHSPALQKFMDVLYGSNTFWKQIQTSMNIPTYGANFVSNGIQMLMSGTAPWRIPTLLYDAASAYGGLRNMGRFYEEYLRQGGTKMNFTEAELKQVLEHSGRYQGKGGQLFEFIGKLSSYSELYGKIDDLWRMAKFIEGRKNGLAPREAMFEANKWIMDYSLAHPAAKWARSLPIGVPFIMYQYKILPLILESAVKRPWVIGMLWKLPQILSNAMLDKMTVDEVKEFLAKLPSRVKDGSTLIIPAGGGLHYIDMSRYVPWGNSQQAANALMKGNVSEAVTQMGFGGMGMQIYNMIMNRDERTGRPLVTPLAKHSGDWKETAKNVTEALWNFSAPPFLRSSGAIKKIYDYHKEGVFPYKSRGEAVPMEWYHAYPRVLGANINPIREEAAAREFKGKINESKRDLLNRLRSATGEKAQQKKDDARSLFREAVKELKKEYRPESIQ